MTDEDLITRLQDHATDVWHYAAADRIKELEAELAGGSFYQEKDIDALQNRISAQAAEIERLRGAMAKLIGGAETVLEAWDHHMRDVVVPASLHDAIEELRADVAGAEGGKP